MYNRKAFKQEAKQLIRASVPHFMLVALVYMLLTTGLNYVVTWLTDGGGVLAGTLSIFLNILVALFTIVMDVGFCNYALRLSRGEETGMNSLFHAFSFTGRSIGMTLLVALFTFLWSLLILGCFAVLVVILVLVAEKAFAAAMVTIVILYIVAVVLIVIIALRYALAPFALVDDPDAGAMEAVRRSVRMMRGYKGKYFVLELSFIGWELLAALIAAIVLGIGFAVGGIGWIYEIAMNAGNDPLAIYGVTENLMSRMSLWILLADVLSLPLMLWLLPYRQTAAARFYNYVCGYDYHQYMNTQPSDAGTPLTPPAQEPPRPFDGSESAQAPEQPQTPPDGYYTSVLPPETAKEDPETPAEAPEAPDGEPETPDGSDEDEEI